jgi:hypothetical protein
VDAVFDKIKRKDISFGEVVTAGATVTEEYYFNFPCSIEKMDITFPIGSNNELQIYPYILRPDEGVEDLLDYVGNKYLVGDNQVKPYSPARSVELGYKLCVRAYNSGAVNHGFTMAVALDMLYGALRVDAGKAVGAHVKFR